MPIYLPKQPDLALFHSPLEVTNQLAAVAKDRSTSDRRQSTQASSAASDHDMEQLQAAAETGDERAFVTACRAIDWQSRSPEDHIRAIDLAFTAGAHLAARELAVQGAEIFPDDPVIQRYARVLAPPVVSKSMLAADPSIGANRDWLSTHGDSYLGQWIGLRNGHLLGSSTSLAGLIGQIGDTNGALLTRVL